MSSLDLQHENEELRLKLKKLEALQQKQKELDRLRNEKPWLYAHKFYEWQREVLNSRSRKQVLCAANQIGKSSIAISKTIEWATNRDLWPILFPNSYRLQKHPHQFWYLYPSQKIATAEFEEKWRPLMPPQDHPVYGWKATYRGRDCDHIHFKAGNYIRFKTYSQDVHSLQTGTLDFIIGDEEMPVELLPELQMRVQATNGYMLFVFTATRGQTFWKHVVEDKTEWKDAAVWQVSLYNCQYYEDGSASQWTNGRIQQAITSCISEAQVQRRIFGRFVRDEGLKFQMWDRKENTMEYEKLSPEWKYYVGVDYGSGGNQGHPSSIAVVAVNTAFTEARLVGLWRGDKIQTTSEDVVNKLQEMTERINDDDLIWIRYDYSAADIGTIAMRRGIVKVQKADKGREAGIATVQSLLKNRALKICLFNDVAAKDNIEERHMEMYKLMEEFENLGEHDDKRHAEDDAVDSLRYALNGVPFDWEEIGAFKGVLVSGDKEEDKEEDRRSERLILTEAFGQQDLIEAEFDYWNEMLED